MKYDLKYPSLEPITGNGDADNVLKGREDRPCEPTTFVELSFEAPLCSEECSEAAWKEYFSYFQDPSCGAIVGESAKGDTWSTPDFCGKPAALWYGPTARSYRCAEHKPTHPDWHPAESDIIR